MNRRPGNVGSGYLPCRRALSNAVGESPTSNAASHRFSPRGVILLAKRLLADNESVDGGFSNGEYWLRLLELDLATTLPLAHRIAAVCIAGHPVNPPSDRVLAT